MKYYFFSFLLFLVSCTKNQNKSENVLEQSYDFYTKGKEIYELNCKYCHTRGGSGAPPLWDFNDWQDRYKKGIDSLLENTFKGYVGKKGIMPPRGGCFKCSKEDLELVIKYMLLIAKVYPPQDSNL
ncbi:MAG: hypothetical protein CBD58_05040 [bacterium TMED198]|nr:MAG: hypothetical protein CBD58_05040 [bacterium TMED198]